MTLCEMIYKRKSVRSYRSETVDEEALSKIREFSSSLTPLYPEIKVRSEIVSKDTVRCLCPWTTEQLIAIYTEERDGALENVGFMFQQLELYMQSLGIGVCWLGMGRMSDRSAAEERNDGLHFVMMLAFGYPDGNALRADVSEFKRKSLADIADIADERLEPARLAPSSVNSQPWYFTHDGDKLHIFCNRSVFRARSLSDMNRIDIGIALAHMYVSNPEDFRFFYDKPSQEPKGYAYEGSFTIA